MNKADLQTQNEELIALLTNLRDQIEEAFDELGIAPEDDDSCESNNGDD